MICLIAALIWTWIYFWALLGHLMVHYDLYDTKRQCTTSITNIWFSSRRLWNVQVLLEEKRMLKYSDWYFWAQIVEVSSWQYTKTLAFIDWIEWCKSFLYLSQISMSVGSGHLSARSPCSAKTPMVPTSVFVEKDCIGSTTSAKVGPMQRKSVNRTWFSSVLHCIIV